MLVDPDGKGMADHWTKAAFAFFSGLILHCCVMVRSREGRMPTLQELTIMMSDPERSSAELLDEMMATDHAALFRGFAPDADERVGEACHIFIASSAREMASKAENEASGVLSSALVNMAIYRDPIININTSRSDFHIHDLMNHENPVNLYLVTPPDGIDRVRPLMRLMLDMIIRRVCAKMEFVDGASKASYLHRLLLMLDELTSLGKLPVLDKAISYIAGYGGKLYIIVQNIKQLNEEYGKENAIMANCHVDFLCSKRDETADSFLRWSGNYGGGKETSISIGGGRGRSRSVNILKQPGPAYARGNACACPAQRRCRRQTSQARPLLNFTAVSHLLRDANSLLQGSDFAQRAKIPASDSEKYPLESRFSVFSRRRHVCSETRAKRK
jgi:type IV secretion system protein VirD4